MANDYKMTHRDAYIFGWIYGRISDEIQDRHDTALAQMRPYSANATIINKARQMHKMRGDLEQDVMEALNLINAIEDPQGGTESVKPLPIQGSWQFGWLAGQCGQPIRADYAFNIPGRRREKDMTQQQLADALGVTQELVSQWESGELTPNEEDMQELRKVLG